MNRDVASPPPPSGLRSLLAVCVPLMHSHSLACSCKTSRDLSKFPPLQKFRLILCVCVCFFLSLLSCLIARIHFRSVDSTCTDDVPWLASAKIHHGFDHDSISHHVEFYPLSCLYLTRSLGASCTVHDFNVNLSADSFLFLSTYTISRAGYPFHSFVATVYSRVGTNDWWWFDVGEMAIDAKKRNSKWRYLQTEQRRLVVIGALMMIARSTVHTMW